MTPSRSRGRLVVIVRAGEDADVGKGPLWSPWWGYASGYPTGKKFITSLQSSKFALEQSIDAGYQQQRATEQEDDYRPIMGYENAT